MLSKPHMVSIKQPASFLCVQSHRGLSCHRGLRGLNMLRPLQKNIRRVVNQSSCKLKRQGIFKRITIFRQRRNRWKKTLVTDRGAKLIIEELIDLFLAEDAPPLFRNIEIETVNRCNGNCSFCPVGKKRDPRAYCKMSRELFASIINQLRELHYDGSISLYSNNEPLLDARIYEFAAMSKASVPKARIVLFTNGKLLTVEKFQKLIPHLDLLVVNDYTKEGQLHDNVRELKVYWEGNKTYGKEICFNLRKPDVILTTRGGAAPNRTVIPPIRSSCLMLFCQMIVRPDGKLSLCCNDPLGQYTLGDLKTESLVDAWRGNLYKRAREKLRQGRSQLHSCNVCDAFLGMEHFELEKLPCYYSLCPHWNFSAVKGSSPL